MDEFTKRQKLLREIATKKIGYPRGSTIPVFHKNLKKLGYRFRKHVNMQSFCQEHPVETRNLILNNYEKTNVLSDKSFYILCLINKENLNLLDFFIKELDKYYHESMEINGLCNKLSELLYRTKDIKYKRKYIKYLYGSSEKDWLGKYKLDIMKICGDFQIEKAIPYLVKSVQYEVGSIRNTALSTLKKYEFQERFHEIYELYPYDDRNLMKQREKEYIKKEDEVLEQGIYSTSSSIPKFMKTLKDKLLKQVDEANVQKFCKEHPEKTILIVKEAYKESTLYSDKRYFLECLSNKNNVDLFSFFIKELEAYQNKANELENIILTIQLFLIYTSDISLKNKYISLLQDENMYYNLGCIINVCTKLKIDEVESSILKIAKDKKSIFVAEALQYLCQYKNAKKYQGIFQMYSLSPYDDVRESAKMGLSIIEKKSNIKRDINMEKYNVS